MQILRNTLENTRLSFLKKLESFIKEKFQDWELSEDDYRKILESINNPDFSRFLLLYLSVESIEILIESLAQAIIIYRHWYGWDEYAEALVTFIFWHAFAKILYTYVFAKIIDFREPILFSFFNSLPLWNFYTPTRWLSWQDTKALLASISMIKEKVHDIVTYNKIVSHTSFQSFIRIIS